MLKTNKLLISQLNKNFYFGIIIYPQFTLIHDYLHRFPVEH